MIGAIPTPVLSMVEQLSPAGRHELARHLRASLAIKPDLLTVRVGELRPLAEILAEHGQTVSRLHPAAAYDPELRRYADPGTKAGSGPRRRWTAPVQLWRSVEPGFYDELRPAGALSAAALTRKYVSWPQVCRAADGLMGDGRYRGISHPWVNVRPNQPRASSYTREEVIAAIRQCAMALLTRPSCHQYLQWSRARRRAGRSDRLPNQAAIQRTYGGYRAALAAAAISDEEIAAARAEQASNTHSLRTARQALGAATEDLSALGLDIEAVNALTEYGCGGLPLGTAVLLARALGGSLDWLAERTPAVGEPPDAIASVAADRVRALRAQAGISEAELRDRMEMPLGPWRRLLSGGQEPTLAEVAQLADALGTQITAFLEPSHDRTPE